jgi:integrase
MSKVPTLQRDAVSGIIYMHWTEPSPVKGRPGRSRRKSLGTPDMDRAKARLGEFLLMERNAPMPGVALTVADLWAAYDEKHIKRNVESKDTAAWAWGNLSKHFGGLPLSAVSQDVVDEYEDKREAGSIGRGASASSVRRELGALRACFNWSVKRGLVAKELLPEFDLPADSNPSDRWLTSIEITLLMRAARDVSKAMGNRMGRGERFLWLGLETSKRSAAIRELRWQFVDWGTNVIDFDVPGRQRTKKRRGVVPISKNLREPLRRMYDERLADDGYVLDSPAPVWKLVKRIADNAKVPDVSPHVLRHTAATHMARAGVPLWKIAKILGNTLGMVERVYAKHCPDDLREAVDTISGEGVGL